MNNEIYRLNVDTLFNGGHNANEIALFINDFSAVLYPGKGALNGLLKKIEIGPDFPLRCLVGLPETDFTIERQRLVESYFKHIVGAAIKGDIWTTEGDWLPINPSRRVAPLERCVFDIDYALSLGLSKSQWENLVLMNGSIVFRQERLPNQPGLFGQNARLLMALSVYGFAEPIQFFTDSKQP